MKYGLGTTKGRAFLLVPLIVFVIVAVFFTLGYLVTITIGIPFSLGFTLPTRLVGAFVLASGFLFFGCLFRCRKPVDILVSTYVTFSKLRRGVRLEETSIRTEKLIIQGSYRYVRHPLYFDIILLVIGWWLLLDYSFLLFSAIFLLLWFNFVVTRFEEKELRAIFREQYEQYSKEAPKIIPFTRCHKK